jgi:glycosyltransferase involved in cell wall biosynthesis
VVDLGRVRSLHAVLVGGDHGTPSYRYRVEHLREQLALLGVRTSVLRHGMPLDGLRVAEAQRGVLILHRVGMDAWVAAAMSWARRRGWPVVADIDDLVFDTGVTPWVRGLEVLPPGSAAAYDVGVRMYRRCLEAADAVLVPTAALAREVARLGRPAFVHPNALCTDQLALAEAVVGARSRRAAGGPVTVGYFSGTHTHNYDFRACAGALAAVMRRRPDVRLLLVGPLDLDAELEALAHRITRLPLVDWRRLPAVMGRADVNLAPLEPDNPFCQAKSELKYIEAGVLGIPTVASPTEAFRHAITPGRNGLLAADAHEWERSLETLVDDRALRERLGEEARRDVHRRYHPHARAVDLARILWALAPAGP